MTIDAAVLIGEGPDSLEGTKVTTPAGADLFREGVVISDPEIPGARAEVRQMGTNLTTDDWGLVTHSVIQGFSTAQGGGYHDVKVTPSGALTVEAVVTGVVSVEGTVNIAEPVTVDGTVALDAATLAALENINATVSGSVSVSNFPATQAVSATDLDIRNLSSAQDSVTVTGSVNAAVTGTVEITNDVGNPIPVSGTVAVTDGGGSITVDGSVAVNNFPATQAVSATDLDIRNLSSAQDSVSVTGSVNVGNFPTTQQVSGTVALDSATLAALETTTVSVNNFPATQAVSGTVTANLGTLNGAATAANQTTGNTSLSSLDAKTPDESGTWGYNAGTAGTLTVAANKRILAITATAGALLGASMTINGGQTITIPAGTALTITPRANLTAPTLVFTSTASYFVEFIE